MISLVILLAFNSVNSIVIKGGNPNSSKDEKYIDVKNISQSSITIPKVLIDDTDPARNWSYTALTYDWCNGKGELNDPYVIENITIDGENSGSCIEIRNSYIYFRIEGCTLYNSSLDSFGNEDAGIKLVNVKNGKIINNNCSNNRGYGIFLYQNSNKLDIIKKIKTANFINRSKNLLDIFQSPLRRKQAILDRSYILQMPVICGYMNL